VRVSALACARNAPPLSPTAPELPQRTRSSLPERFRGCCPFGATDIFESGELSRAALSAGLGYSERIGDRGSHAPQPQKLRRNAGFRPERLPLAHSFQEFGDSDFDDGDEILEPLKSSPLRVTKGESSARAVAAISKSANPRLDSAALFYDSGMHAPIRPSRSNVERHRVECCLGPL